MDAREHARAVGERIERLRGGRGLSIEEAAAEFRRATGRTTTQNTYRRWELRGKLEVEELFDLAAFYEVDPVWLISGGGRRAAERPGPRDDADAPSSSSVQGEDGGGRSVPRPARGRRAPRGTRGRK